MNTRTSALALFLLLGCSKDVADHEHEAADIDDLPLGTSNGGGWAASAPDAPWEFGQINTALFVTDPGNDGNNAEGLLFLASGDVTCDAIRDIQNMWSIDGLIGDHTGLLFGIEVYTDDGNDGPPPSFEGLYMGGYGYGLQGEERSLYAAAFDGGEYWIVGGYGGGNTWLRVNTSDNEQIVGEYYASFWAGEFIAVNCGNWTVTYDTGDYGYY